MSQNCPVKLKKMIEILLFKKYLNFYRNYDKNLDLPCMDQTFWQFIDFIPRRFAIRVVAGCVLMATT